MPKYNAGEVFLKVPEEDPAGCGWSILVKERGNFAKKESHHGGFEHDDIRRCQRGRKGSSSSSSSHAERNEEGERSEIVKEGRWLVATKSSQGGMQKGKGSTFGYK